MHAAQPAAVGVDRQPAPGRNAAVRDELLAFALGAEAKVFEEQQRVDGEGVVELDDVDVLGGKARHGEGAAAGLGCGGDRQVFHRRDLPVPNRRRVAQHIDGRTRHIAGAVGAHQHVGARAVGDQAAIAHAQGVGHHARGQDLIQRGRFAQLRFRIELRPLVGRQRHPRQILTSGAVLMHVPGGCQRIRGQRVERIVGRFVRLRIELLAHAPDLGAAERGRALRAAVADQHGIALAGGQRVQRRHQMRHEARAAQHGAVDERRADAQVFDHRHGPHRRGHAGRADAIDVAHRQARVRHGALRRLHQDFHFGKARGLSEARVAHAGHRHGAAQFVQRHAASLLGTKTTTPRPSCWITCARTAMPMRTASGATPSTRLINRTPSCRSISATL